MEAKVHTYLVELRIVGDWIDEKDVSELIGLKASQFIRKGAPQYQRVAQDSVWQLDARPGPDSLEWASLEDGLTSLVQTLMPVKKAINDLQSSYDVSIVCGHFTSDFGGGPTLSPAVLELLARLAVKLTISSYFGREGGE